MSTSQMTLDDVCARVRSRLNIAVPLALIPRVDQAIALSVPAGMERLARAVKDSTDRHLLIKDTGALPSAGVIDLSAATFTNILIDTYKLPGAIRTQTDSAVTFQKAPSLDALRAASPTDSNVVWFDLSGSKLTFKHPTTGALNTYNTPLFLRGSYIPVFGSVSLPMVAELDDQLIQIITEIVKQVDLNALKPDEELAAEKTP